MIGLFSFYKNIKNQKSNNIDLAEKLFATLFISTGSMSEKGKRQIAIILKQCPTQQDIINKVIELCGEPITSRQRYLYAKAYALSKVEYRKLAIKYLELYLNNPLYEDAFKNYHHSLGDKQFSLAEERNIHLSEMYYCLGKAYDGEYGFDKALDYYQKEQSLIPFYPAPYCHICSILIKQNKLSEAMGTYLVAKKSPHYKPFKHKNMLGKLYTEDTFKKVIDNHIIELQEKIDKGYVYKSRKSKEKV